MIDARPPRQYSGEEGEEIRRGHIPGAKNIFWETTLEGEEVRVWKKERGSGETLHGIGGNKRQRGRCPLPHRERGEPRLFYIKTCPWISQGSSLSGGLGGMVCG